MLHFNTSTFSNLLDALNCTARRKALVTPFKEKFDGTSDNFLQHIADFNQCYEDSGIVEDFKFFEEEHLPPSDIDMTDLKAHTASLSDPHHFTFGNILFISIYRKTSTSP
jgi:hypothetical protein